MTDQTSFCAECRALRVYGHAGWCSDCWRKGAVEDIRTGALNRLWEAMKHCWMGDRHRAAYDLQMAWERATNTGDYRPGGYFDTRYPGWRNDKTKAGSLS